MIGKAGQNNFIKVCLPLDESEPALCSEDSQECGDRAAFVESEKKKNENNIERIRTGKVKKKISPGVLNMIKLLPGEHIKNKEKNIDIHSNSVYQ
jgi:hypothetical protein